jgi:hypothetical protein
MINYLLLISADYVLCWQSIDLYASSRLSAALRALTSARLDHAT